MKHFLDHYNFVIIGGTNFLRICYDGEMLTMSKDYTKIRILGQPSDPRLRTHTG